MASQKRISYNDEVNNFFEEFPEEWVQTFEDQGGSVVLVAVTISAARLDDDMITFRRVSFGSVPKKASFTLLVKIISRLFRDKRNLAETFWDKRESSQEG